jgi:hypothetical protein
MSVGNVRLALGPKQARLILEAIGRGLDQIRDEMDIDEDNQFNWSEKDYESALSVFRKLHQAVPKEES